MGNTSNLEQWAARERMTFVERTAYWRGVVNRGDLTQIFGVSAAQASADLTRYQEANPGALLYQMRKKRYEGTKEMQCVLHEPRLEEAIGLFLGEDASVPLGFKASLALRPGGPNRVAKVELPVREGRTQVQRRMFLAVLQGLRIHIRYGSVRSNENEDRWVRPHAFGHDGYRWHARAWCERNCDFRDFVISRIEEAAWPSEQAPLPQEDGKWNTWKILKLSANKLLKDWERKNIESDYGMIEGKFELRVREAMLEYTLAHLRLPLPDGNERPRHLEMLDG